jgi:hypothetical protein
MNKKILPLLAAIIFLNSVSSAQSFDIRKAGPETWLKSWLLCGPIGLNEKADQAGSARHLEGFSNDYLLRSGGEANPNIREGDVVHIKGKSLKWFRFTSPDSIIDLDKTFSGMDRVMAYAYTEINTDEPGIVVIGLGTNDGGSLWLNGSKVWDYSPARPLSVDNDLIPVALKKGVNKLLLKVEDKGNRWEFCARLLPFSAEKLVENGTFFRINTASNGTAKLTTDLSEDLLKEVVKKLELRISDQNQAVISQIITETGFMRPLDIPSSEYQPYSASFEITLRSGEILRQKIGFYAGLRKEHTLFSSGYTDYTITTASGASLSEKWAARELQHWIREAGGVTLPIDSSGSVLSGPRIAIGFTGEVKALTGSTAPADQDESFRYLSIDGNIFIWGGRMRGSMYGVISFLERELGCRWYTPRVTSVPQKNEYVFVHLDHSEKPGIRVRNDFYYEAFDPLWAARNRMNGAMSDRKQPGGTESYWAVHTFYPLMPPSEFFNKHPEYYSLINGKRTDTNAQLCLSNPDVLKIITERIKKTMKENPDYLIYDVSQNDCYNPCQCEKCQAIAKKYGGESGVIIWFVNQVAEEVKKEFPDKFIGTLAYQYTRTPPENIHPLDNVVVRLCSIECCFAHDFNSCPENASFLHDLRKWSSLAPHMYIWDYVVNFSHYILPYPNFSVLQPNIRTFRENNSIGIMEQAAYQGRGGEFSELRSYLIARLLWDPECNTEEVINDFISGYYGRSGVFIRKYFDLLQGSIRPDTHIHLGLSPTNRIFSDQFVNDAAEIFRQAEKVADNDEILKRVEMASLPLLYLKCLRSPSLSKYDGSYEKFCRITEREGVAFFAEAGAAHRLAFHKLMEEAGE